MTRHHDPADMHPRDVVARLVRGQEREQDLLEMLGLADYDAPQPHPIYKGTANRAVPRKRVAR